MINETKLTKIFERIGLPEAGRRMTMRIRSSDPARRVRSSTKNVSVRYPSKKMGFVVQAESHKNEFAALYEFELDDNVLEYFDQPVQIKLNYMSKQQKVVGVLHTPDYFIITDDAAGFVECKTENDLEKLAEKMPERYMKGDEGKWRCPPGEEAAAKFGFFYRVRSSSETNWIFQRNAKFLDQYYRKNSYDVDDDAAAEIIQVVENEPGIPLRKLLNHISNIEIVTSDDVYLMIVAERIFVDLMKAPLAEPDAVNVFIDRQTAKSHVIIPDTLSYEAAGGFQSVRMEMHELVTWNTRVWRIVNVGEELIYLREEEATQQNSIIKLTLMEFQGLVEEGDITGSSQWIASEMSAEARRLLDKASPADLEVANQWYRIIKTVLDGHEPAETIPERTLYRHIANYEEAKAIHRCGYVGLLRQYSRSGNRRSKLEAETKDLMEKYISEKYETFKQKTKLVVYGEFALECERQGLVAPSYKTFHRGVKSRSQRKQKRNREGRKAAYQDEAFFWELEFTTPRHGDRPFEYGHIDHTQLDAEMLHSVTEKNLGSPWVTFLMVAFDKELLAVVASYNSPSAESCMAVIRECVRRHKRIPETLIVDGGSEFGSIMFETLLARYEITKKTRPASKARFGSVVERLFGTSNTQFIHNLAGNTQSTKNSRQLTKENNPKNLANWTLPRLYRRLRQWAYEIYNNTEHPVPGQTPYEARAMGLSQSGERRHRMIEYNEDFVRDTMPTTAKGTAKVNYNRGVKILYINYWNNEFRHPEVAGTQVPVRYDSEDRGIAYAFVRGRWIKCISEHYARFKGRSAKIVKLATEELLAKDRRHARRLAITAKRIAEFIESLEREEKYYEDFWRDADNQKVAALVEGVDSADEVHVVEEYVQDSSAVSPDPLGGDDGEIDAVPVF